MRRVGLRAVHVGHHEVHEDDVRAQFEAAVDRFGPAARLAHVLEVVEGEEEGGEPASDDRLIVNDHDPDHIVTCYFSSLSGHRGQGPCASSAPYAARSFFDGRQQYTGSLATWPDGQCRDSPPRQSKVSPSGWRAGGASSLVLGP